MKIEQIIVEPNLDERMRQVIFQILANEKLRASDFIDDSAFLRACTLDLIRLAPNEEKFIVTKDGKDLFGILT
ncbi:hypothetical protein KJ707_01245 [Patescibacteria group bacterium]|nr:hypothetical protein [Patescibacteria group bacterium]MBU2543180.1 hypothetical protein [Patescibacteria group bacterium]